MNRLTCSPKRLVGCQYHKPPSPLNDDLNNTSWSQTTSRMLNAAYDPFNRLCSNSVEVCDMVWIIFSN